MMSVQQEAHAGMFIRRALEFILSMGVLLLGAGILLFDSAWAHPLYHTLSDVAPARAWGTVWVMLGTARAIIVVINGFWPLSPFARLSLAATTLLLVWLPLSFTYLAYLRAFLLDASGGFVPGIVLTGIAVMTEALCMYALAALTEARRQTSQGGGHVR